jgi:hypothetical protein
MAVQEIGCPMTPSLLLLIGDQCEPATVCCVKNMAGDV